MTHDPDLWQRPLPGISCSCLPSSPTRQSSRCGFPILSSVMLRGERARSVGISSQAKQPRKTPLVRTLSSTASLRVGGDIWPPGRGLRPHHHTLLGVSSVGWKAFCDVHRARGRSPMVRLICVTRRFFRRGETRCSGIEFCAFGL